MSKVFDVDGEFSVSSTGDINLNSSSGVVNITASSGPTVFNNDVTINGDFIVSGTASTISSTDTALKDNIIILNDGEVSAGITSGFSGIEVDRGSLDNVLIRYNETSDKWELTNDGSTYSDIVTGSTSGVFLTAVLDDTTPQLGGDLDLNGSKIITNNTNQDIVFDPSGTGAVISQATVLPGTDSTYNLGASGNEWSTAYIDTVTATNIGGTLTTATQNSVTTMTGLTTTGALNSGSIASGFGNIDIGSSTLDAGVSTLGSVVLDDGRDILNATTNNSTQISGGTTNVLGGNIRMYGEAHATQADDIEFRGSATLQLHYDDSGSLWDFQANGITTTGSVTGNTLVGTLTTAAQTNITSLGTLTALQVDNVNINGNTISSTDTNGNVVIDPDGTGILSITGTNAFQPPSGTTAQRPGSPAGGYTRYNSTTGKVEFYNGDTTSWEAAGITISGQIYGDSFTGDGSTSVFVISASNEEENELFVTIQGVVQDPVTAYTVTGTNLTFTTPPDNGDSIIVRNLTASQVVSQVIDQDSDTYIDVEESTDDDTIRFYTTGTQRGQIDSAGDWHIESSEMYLDNAAPKLYWNETDAAADNTKWRIAVDTETLVHQVVNDAENSATSYITVNRTANTVDDVTIAATAVGLTGVTTITGATTITGDLTFDDSGTANTITFNTATGAYGIYGDRTNGSAQIGGSTTNDGGNILFYGSTHSGNPGDFILRDGTTSIIAYDASADTVVTSNDDWTFGNDVTVTGDLTVNGTTTTISTTNTVVTDSLLELANGTAGAPVNDSGMVVERGSSDNVFWGWDEATDEWTVGTGSFTGASSGALTTTDAAIRVASGVFSNGNLEVTTGNIINGAASAIQNIGTASDPWTNVYADQFHGVATKAQYADVAERYHSDATYETATVMVFGGDNEVTQATSYNDHRVAGVVSSSPAYAMNEKAGPQETHPYIALTGRVPCKVYGTIKKGDLMVTSDIAGVATVRSVATPFLPGTILGKALEDYDSEEIGIIEVVLGLS